MRALSILASLCSLLATPAVAQQSPLVHVRSTRADGAVSHGSGVALGGEMVLTARHVLACGVFDSVEWGDDGQRAARAVHSDPGLDLVLLRVPGLRAPTLPLAPGAEGLVAAGVLGIRSTAMHAPVRWADGATVGLESVRLPGDSGGPVLGAAGLLAVVTEAAPGSLGQGLAVGPGPDALREFLAAPRRMPCSPRDRRVVGALSRSREAQLAGQPERALRALVGLRGGGGLPASLATRRARALSALGRYRDAEATLDAGMETQGPDARRSLGALRARLMAGDPVFLDEYLEVARHAESGVLLRLGSELLAEQGRPAEGVELTDDTLAVHGPAPHLFASRCRARRLFSDLAGAREDCLAALAGPERPLSALLDLGSILLELAQYDLARSLLDEAASRADGAPVLLLRALASLAGGRGEEDWRAARADAESVLARPGIGPQSRGPALFLRAVASALLGDVASAGRDADAAAETTPGDPRIQRLQRALAAGVGIQGIDGAGRVRLRDAGSP